MEVRQTSRGNNYYYTEDRLSFLKWATGRQRRHWPFLGYTSSQNVHVYRLNIPFGGWLATKTRRHEEKHVDINYLFTVFDGQRFLDKHRELDRITWHGLLDWRWK